MAITPTPASPSIQNQRVRFGLQGNEIYDYGSSSHLPLIGRFTTEDGLIFDLAAVAKAIREGKFIETAIIGRTAPKK